MTTLVVIASVIVIFAIGAWLDSWDSKRRKPVLEKILDIQARELITFEEDLLLSLYDEAKEHWNNGGARGSTVLTGVFYRIAGKISLLRFQKSLTQSPPTDKV